jgi:tetratricopeptide (TPR) repeat protein
MSMDLNWSSSAALKGDRAMYDASRVFRGLVTGLILVCWFSPLSAQDKPAAQDKPVEPDPASPADPVSRGYQAQESDDPALPLKPAVPRSAAADAKNEALAWYMTGRLLDATHRNEPRKALNAYLKAVQIDPGAIQVYRELVPLEFQFDNVAAAVRHAAKAVQLDPDDVEILQLLARQAAMTGQLPEAIKHLEQAIKSPRIDKQSAEFIGLNRSLGLLYVLIGQKESAADAFEILFEAVQNPEKYGLDARAKKSLLVEPTTYEKIGQVLLDGNRLKPALEAFELAASTRQGAGNLAFNRAKILLLSDKPEEALDELQKYFDKQRITKGREAYQLLADILKKLKRSDELIGRLETLAEVDAQNVALQYFLADRLVDVNELDRARKIYDSMLQSGGDGSGYVGLARVLRKMQKSDELLEALGRGMARGEDAIAILEPEIKALSEDKALVAMLIESGRVRAASNRLKFEEAYLLAKLAAALKDADASGEFYKLAIASSQGVGRPPILIQIEQADMYMKLRKYRLAVDALQEILNSKQLTEAGQARTYSSLAQALTYINQTEKAIEAISEAIKLDDDNPGYRYFESWVYSHARRWEEAIQKLNQLMKDFPDEKEVIMLSQFSLSNIYVQKGELHKGEEILEKILEINPDNTQANNDLGYLWADQGKNLEKSEKMIRRALAAEPDNGAYLDSLGWVLFKLEKAEEAVPPLEQATKMNMGSDATVWDHLGDVFLKLMRTEKAIEAWQTAIQHSEEDSSQDPDLIERIKDKLKQHGAQALPKPAEKGSP